MNPQMRGSERLPAEPQQARQALWFVHMIWISSLALLALGSVVALLMVGLGTGEKITDDSTWRQPTETFVRDSAAMIVSVTPTSTPTPPTSTPTSTPTPPTSTPTATAHDCKPATTYLDAINIQEQHGQWEAAAGSADLALADPNLCTSERDVLTAKAVADHLEGLLTQPFYPKDMIAQKNVVDRYHALKRRAEQAGVPFLSPIQVAQRAYSVGQFRLAKTALEDAYMSGSFTLSDQGLIQQYAATLYNLGHWSVQSESGALKAEGLQLLVASYHIDDQFKVGSGEARRALQELLGMDESSWPVPAPTPLLIGRSH
jgi:hypothetical protein